MMFVYCKSTKCPKRVILHMPQGTLGCSNIEESGLRGHENYIHIENVPETKPTIALDDLYKMQDDGTLPEVSCCRSVKSRSTRFWWRRGKCAQKVMQMLELMILPTRLQTVSAMTPLKCNLTSPPWSRAWNWSGAIEPAHHPRWPAMAL